jgi:hypothetical protein
MDEKNQIELNLVNLIVYHKYLQKNPMNFLQKIFSISLPKFACCRAEKLNSIDIVRSI